MKNNHDHPSTPWLDDALGAHLAARAPLPAPTPDFTARCRSAALAALDVIKMREQRPSSHTTASLFDHFKELARLAGVRIAHVFATMGIGSGESAGVKHTLGLTRLARQLGIARDEAVLRLRLGFAELAGVDAAAPAEGGALVRARGKRGNAGDSVPLDEMLHRIESSYPPERRAELRAAMNALAQVYEEKEL